MATTDDLCPKCSSALVNDDSLFTCSNPKCRFRFMDTKDGSVKSEDTIEDTISRKQLHLASAKTLLLGLATHGEGLQLLVGLIAKLGRVDTEELHRVYRRYASHPMDKDIGSFVEGTWAYRKFQIFKAGWMARVIYEETMHKGSK
jgi:hypothetical protein